MTKKSFFTFLLFALCVSRPLFAEDKITLAIAMFEGEKGSMSAGISDTFMTALSKSDKITLVERSQVEKVVKEIGLGMSGFVDEVTAAKVGKFVGVKKIVVGSYLQVEWKIILNVRLIDVETGKVDRALSREGEKANLYFLVNQLAQDFHKSLTGKWIPELIPEDIAKTPEGKLEILRQLDPALFLNNPKAKLKVELWLSKKDDAPSYKQQELMTISFRASEDCYVTLFNIDADGKITLIFPNTNAFNNRVEKGKTYTIPEKDADYEFAVSGAAGEEQVVAIATKEPLELVKNMNELVKNNFMPEVSKTSSEFVARSIQVKLKGSPEENWNAARVKFYLEGE